MRNAPSSPIGAGDSERLTLQRILPLLRNVQRLSNGQYVASCPVPLHGKGRGDVNPSLSLSETPDGRLLVHCHAGCPQEAVLQELRRLAGLDAPRPAQEPQGLTLEEYARAKRLNPEQLQRWGLKTTLYQGQPALLIPYLNEAGDLVAVQYRLALTGDRFRWRAGDKPTLYGLQGVPRYSRRVLWGVEGTSDCHVLWTVNLPAVGFPSASAGVLAPQFWEVASRFERVYLCFDADAAGERLLQAVLEACPEALQERVWVVRLPEGCKDVGDLWLQMDADAEQFRAQVAQLERMSFVEILQSLSIAPFQETERGAKPLLMPLGELLESYDALSLDWLPLLSVEGLIARGSTTLVAAHPKAGKTTLLVHACLEWLQQGLRVVYLSEEPPIAWQLRLQRFPELRELLVNTEASPNPARWRSELRKVAPDVLVVDTLRRFGGVSDEADAAQVAAAVRFFSDLTRDLPQCAVVLAHHTRKSSAGREATVQDIAGSHAFAGEVDTILSLASHADAPRQRVLVPLQSRLWLTAPEPLVLELSEDGLAYRVVGVAPRAASSAEQVLDALRVLGTATAEQLASYLGGSLAERQVRNLLEALVQSGRVVRTGEGKRSNPYVFRLADCGNPAIFRDCTISGNTLLADGFHSARARAEGMQASLFAGGIPPA